MPDAGLTVCTIISKNYLSYARVLAESIRRHNPHAQVFVLLVDRLDGYFAPDREPFELVPLERLGIRDLDRFCFKYSILELNTAVKPTLLRHLLRDQGVKKLLYLDPDIVVYRPLDPLRRLLDHASIIVTPHLTEPLPADGRKPSDKDILVAGAYNLGFIGVRSDETVLRFLEWWESQVHDRCIVDPGAGYFVDQRWMDLAPALFPGVEVVRDAGYNVAYWNLPHRHLEGRGGDLRVNGQPLYFFHFSGAELTRLDSVSKHQDRVSLGDRPDIRPIFEDYHARQVRAGWQTSKDWPYAFATFDNGEKIPAVVRRVYQSLGADAGRFGNPFETAAAGSFWQWLVGWAPEEVAPGSGITNLWHEVYRTRPDLQRAFPSIFGADRVGFQAWIRAGRTVQIMPAALDPDASEPSTSSASVGRHDHHRPSRDGVNLVGHARSEKGVGEALRASARSLSAAGIPYRIVDIVDTSSVNLDTSLDAHARDDRSYSVNLIHLNADAFGPFAAKHAPAFFEGHYNIGYWMWELPEFPETLLNRFGYLDEVWVGSTYCLDTIARVSPVPVVKIPVSLPAGDPPTKHVGRSHFGIPDGSFVFLFIFDVHSVVARKNPEAVIDAFRRAFPGRENVRLVLKFSHGDDALRQTLLARARDPRLILIDQVLDRPELNSLIEASDCYVSLHRSEGFGVTIAEAMTFAKPVIATGYSANMDFMNASNSFPVRYDLVTLDQDYHPYRRGNTWANPDVQHAAELMRLVYESPDRAREQGRLGQRDIRRYLDPSAIGRRIEGRLSLIRQRMAAEPPGARSPVGAPLPVRNGNVPSVPIPAATSARPLVGGVIALLKRAARRSVSWYIAPQVSALRAALTRVQEHATTAGLQYRQDLNRIMRRLGYAESGASIDRSRLTEIESRLADVERKVGLETPSDPERG